MASRTDQARELALHVIARRPGVQQRDVAAAIEQETGLAVSTAVRVLREMEREGVLEGSLDGRRRTYALSEAAGPRAAAWAKAEPAAAPAADAGTSRGTRGELVAVVAALFIAASLVAFVLAPDKDDDSGGGGSANPAAAPAPPPEEPATQAEPAPAPKAKPKPKPRPRRSPGALAAAKRTQVAVLSGSPVPGIAGRTGDALKRRGFRVGTVANAPGPSERSLVLYARGKKDAARALARSVKIRAVKPVDANSKTAAPGAGLIVIVGADRRR